MFSMHAAGLSDVGRLRKNNEDSFVVAGSLLIVADGMGGAAAGEIASSVTVETIRKKLNGMLSDDFDNLSQMVKTAILESDKAIKEKTQVNPEMNGMGTTVVLAIHCGSHILLANVGDSRAYIVSDTKGAMSPKNDAPFSADAAAQTAILTPIALDTLAKETASIKRVTEDHSIVMDLVRNGVITENDIRTHPLRNRITRCVGSLREDGADVSWLDINDNDVLILCSDGLWEMVHEDIMLAITKSSGSMEETCKRLIAAANDAGGTDNITVIAARFIAM